MPTSNRIPSHISYLGEQPAFSICGSNNGCDYGRDGLNLLRANDTKFKSSSNDSVHFPARPPQTSSLAETFAFPANGYRGFSDCSLGSTSASSERSDVTSQGSSHYDAVLARLTAECKWRRKCPQLQKALIYWNSLALPSHSLQGDLANCSLATKVRYYCLFSCHPRGVLNQLKDGTSYEVCYIIFQFRWCSSNVFA